MIRVFGHKIVKSFGVASLPILAGILGACYNSAGNVVVQQRQPGQGIYQYPVYQQPEPTRYIPQPDLCGIRLYSGLVGQHIGGVHIAVIAGDKRIIQPAELEIDEVEFLQDMQELPPFVQVTDLLAGQPLYAASVRTGVYRGQLGPDRADRLTLELDRDGYVQTVECR